MKTLVRIIENACIGCTKCVGACPVDAIIGGPQLLHAVLSEYCIGCNLCLPVCPVNCIEIIPRSDGVLNKSLAKTAKRRVKERKSRLERYAAKEQKERESISAHLEEELKASLARAQLKDKLRWSACE